MMASCGCNPSALSASWYGSGCGFGRADSSPRTTMSKYSLHAEGPPCFDRLLNMRDHLSHTGSGAPAPTSGTQTRLVTRCHIPVLAQSAGACAPAGRERAHPRPSAASMTRAFSRGALVTAAFFSPRSSIHAMNSVSPGTLSSTESAWQPLHELLSCESVESHLLLCELLYHVSVESHLPLCKLLYCQSDESHLRSSTRPLVFTTLVTFHCFLQVL